MPALSRLKSLQALEMALRCGLLRAAAQQLGITPAAIGQRIRALEEHLDTQLLKRGPSGLEPSATHGRTARPESGLRSTGACK